MLCKDAALTVELYILYAQKDEKLFIELACHLTQLERAGLVTIYHKGNVQPGEDYKQTHSLHMQHACIIVPLLSCYFMASDVCVELEHLLKHRLPPSLHIVPIILRHVDWQGSAFGVLRALPDNDIPVDSARNRHQTWTSITRRIRELVVDLADRQLL